MAFPGVVVGQPMRHVKDGQMPAWVFVHAYRGAHKMRPERARRDLQGESAPFDGVVGVDPAFLLDAQDVANPAAAVGDKSAAGLDRRHREGGIVGRPVSLASQRLAAAIVVMPASASSFGSRCCKVRKARSERSVRLGRIGRDMADAELRQRAPDLGLHALRHPLPGLGRLEIVDAAVGAELAE